MFVDASAVVAIIAGEPEAGDFLDRLARSPKPPIYAPTVLFEAAASLARIKSGDRPPRAVEERAAIFEACEVLVVAFFETIGAREVDISPTTGALAREAARRFGKIVGHPADLNFGDCFAYAVAREHAVALLAKGDDFPRTDAVLA